MPQSPRIITTCLAGTALALLAACGPAANQGAVSDASGVPTAAPPSDKPAGGTATWGKRYTWPDGVAVEVTAPTPCKPGEFAAPPNVVRAVKFTVTITNGSGKPFDTNVLTLGSDAQFDGTRADAVFDSGGPCGQGADSTTVLPGKTFTYSAAYSVGPKPGELQLTFQPSFSEDKAVFTGQV